jgi:acyl-CoA synthetase (NDP forming)
MSNPTDAARKLDPVAATSNSKDAVRRVLDAVKADKRTSLTAPEGKLVCDAYGIPVPQEGVAKSAEPTIEADGLPGGDEGRPRPTFSTRPRRAA